MNKVFSESRYVCFNCGKEPNRHIEIKKPGKFGGKGKIVKEAYVCRSCYPLVADGKFPVGAEYSTKISLKSRIDPKVLLMLQKQKEEADKKMVLAKEKGIV